MATAFESAIEALKVTNPELAATLEAKHKEEEAAAAMMAAASEEAKKAARMEAACKAYVEGTASGSSLGGKKI